MPDRGITNVQKSLDSGRVLRRLRTWLAKASSDDLAHSHHLAPGSSSTGPHASQDRRGGASCWCWGVGRRDTARTMNDMQVVEGRASCGQGLGGIGLACTCRSPSLACISYCISSFFPRASTTSSLHQHHVDSVQDHAGEYHSWYRRDCRLRALGTNSGKGGEFRLSFKRPGTD